MNESTPALGTARRHREEFGAALDALEDWVSTEVGPGWGLELAERVLGIEEFLVEHVSLVEHPGTGLFDDIVATAPRLAHAVQLLRDEHPELLHRARAAVDVARTVGEPPAEPDASAAATTARSLAEAIRSHRRRGAHVVYEAYDLDLGDGD